MKHILYTLIMLSLLGNCKPDSSWLHLSGEMEGVTYSDFYQVRVNGHAAPLYYSQVGAFVSFTFSGNVEIEIECEGAVHKAEVLPGHLDIGKKIEGKKVVLSLDRATDCFVKINDNYVYPLMVFAHGVSDWMVDSLDEKVRYFAADRVYEAGEIHLNSGETLFIEEGAYVKGCVVAEGASDIRICGNGILEGSMYPQMEKPAINLKDCRNVRIEGLISVDPSFRNLVLNRCTNVEVKDFTGIGTRERRMSDDGINIIESCDVIIEGAFINARNNCIALQSNPNVTRPVERIRVRNSVFWKGDFGMVMEFGYKTDDLIARDVEYSNIDVLHSLSGVFGLSSKSGKASNFRFSNIRVSDVRHMLFAINQLGENASMVNIRFEDVTVLDGPICFSDIHAITEDGIRGISFENLKYGEKKILNPLDAHFRKFKGDVIFK